ncbi:MAG: lipocalin family protein [Xanthomonadaceae bacterium]|nr:lipocalin family protein [Xanthomonadaceae bacterium]
MHLNFYRLCAALAMAPSALAMQPALAQSATGQPLTTIASLDLPRYMGTWYEIARYPNSFQQKCTGNTRAEYSIKGDGGVQVINRCKLQSGELNEIVGAGRQIGSATSPKLEVRFSPAWLSFIPAVWGDYWVIDLDAAYQLVAVSDDRREYLWVLSRTPWVEPKAYEALLGRLGQKGFDLQKLQLTPQD